MIKNMLAVVLAVFVLFSFAACGTNNGNNVTDGTNGGNNITDGTNDGVDTRGITNDITHDDGTVRNTTDGNIIDNTNVR